MAKRTYLDTSDGMVAYAQRHGAKFDKVLGAWYVEGEVPNELLGLIPKKINPSVHVVAPACPVCKSHMVERTRKSDGHSFWGCSRYPSCKGIMDLAEHLDSFAPSPKSAIDFLKSSDASLAKSPLSRETKRASILPAQRALIERVTLLAVRVLGGANRAGKWLSSPKVGLKGQIPLRCMNTESGCRLVEQLLLSIEE